MKRNKTQLQGGYTLDFVKNYLIEEAKEDKNNIEALLQSLCYFNVESLESTKPTNKDDICSELAVIHNQLLRGLPTRPSMFVEENILKALGVGKSTVTPLGDIEAQTNENFESVKGFLIKSLHIIAPRINPNKSQVKLEPSFEYDPSVGSIYEENFLFKHAPKYLGEEWFQLLESQREITSILKSKNSTQDYLRQKTDFSVELPYYKCQKGIVIEIDGPQHEEEEQRLLDQSRDREIKKTNNWSSTIRIQTSKNSEEIQTILTEKSDTITQEPYLNLVKENYNNPLYQNKEGLKALQLTLSPLAIARIQRVIIDLLLKQSLDLKAPLWKVAVIEQDVPCAALALADLKAQIENLFLLQDKSVSPQIELTIFRTEEFEDSALNKIDLSPHFSKIQFLTISELNKELEVDVIIDVSMLQRDNYFGNSYNEFLNYSGYYTIRSAHHISSERSFLTADIIDYSVFIGGDESPLEKRRKIKRIHTLETILQDLFRKETFKQGQIEILNLALQGKSVVGLLPTGGGKSLTYQMASLLQPGICLVISPLISLMRDQHRGLNNNQIDACSIINSSLSTDQRVQELTKLQRGQTLICFISPERLQIREFRNSLRAMGHKKIYFSYCVIDEAHCISEWGHDFRTPYLNLGRNTRRHCKTKNKEQVPLFALTATASFDVLADIQRELSAESSAQLTEDCIIYLENIHREELTYEIIEVEAGLRLWHSRKKAWTHLSDSKISTLKRILSEFPFDIGNNYSGIIFCPHRKNVFGVETIASEIESKKIENITIGEFVGGGDSNGSTEQNLEKYLTAQEDFVNNKLNLLVATNAFGMGIDKPNVRFTFHLSYPNSIESFVQESGRAGRDKNPAKCMILFNREHYSTQKKEVEREIQEFFYNISFQGIGKENDSMVKLLTQKTKEEPLRVIEAEIRDKFGEIVELDLLYETPNQHLLKLTGISSEITARILMPSLEYSIISDTPEDSSEILEHIVTHIKENCNEKPINWILNSTTTVEEALSQKKPVHLTIHSDETDSKDDKEKALYRLLTLGVIDDYTKDYNSNTFTITTKGRNENDYIETLRNYIGKYYSEIRTELEIEKAKNFGEGETITQKYLFFLTDFIYREVAQKRLTKIGVMKEACIRGLEGGNDALKEFIKYYFDSKYAKKGYEIYQNGQMVNASLLDRTNQGREENINWVWEFTEIVEKDESGSHIINLKHLNGACTRLLTSQPNNGTLHLLKAFSLLILEPENKILRDEILISLRQGFLAFGEKNISMNKNLFKAELQRFTANQTLQEVVEEAIKTKISENY
jgi:ATP-dependent DNA helicase RecQ